MKNKNLTFADKARAIEQKYNRYAKTISGKKKELDPLSQASFDREMNALMLEQEAFKQANELYNPQDMQGGEQPTFANAGYMNIPEEPIEDKNLLYYGKKVLGAIGNAYDYVNTLGHTLPQGNPSYLNINGEQVPSGLPTSYTGVAPIPGRGIKGNIGRGIRGLGNKQLNPLTSFTNLGEGLVTPSRDALRGIASTRNAVIREGDDITKASRNIYKEFFNTFKGKTPTTKIGNLSTKMEGAVPSKAEQIYGDLQKIGDKWYQVDPSTGIKVPWKNIGYGAAGIGAAGALGLGIYGLTQLPDGIVVDKQGKVVSPEVVKSLNIDAISGPDYHTPQGYENVQAQAQAQPTSVEVPSKPRTVSVRTKKNIPLEQIDYTAQSFKPEENLTLMNSLTARSKSPYTALPTQALQPMGNTPTERTPLQSNTGNEFWNKNKQYLPYAASGLANIAGNLLMAKEAGKYNRINPTLATPERINLEPKAEQLRRDAGVSKNINMANARNLGLTSGLAMAGMNAANTGVDRVLGDTLTNLYIQQEGANTGAVNQFALQNQDAMNRANMYNAQMEQDTQRMKLGFLDNAIGTIPGVMKDIRLDKSDKEMRGVMDAYYKSSGGTNYMPVGSIFDSGFGKYVVKGHNPDGTPITEKIEDSKLNSDALTKAKLYNYNTPLTKFNFNNYKR